MATIISNPTTITVASAPSTSSTSLGQAANALAAGSSINFSTGPVWETGDSVTWQTATVYYDPARKYVHAVGKIASVTGYEHYIYNEATNSWGSNTINLTNYGHMWATAFDPSAGEYYFLEWGKAIWCWRYVPGIGWSKLPPTPPEEYVGGLGWHPNLYGAGDGGLVIVGPLNSSWAWRKQTNIWSTIQTGQASCGYNGGSGAWDSVNNKLWVGTGNSGRSVIVGVGSNGSIGSISTPPNPPLLVYGGGEGDSTNKVIPHPGTAGKLLLLSSNDSRVWTSTNSGATWSSAGYSHPFVIGNGQWTCGPIPAYGVVWGLSSPGRGSMSKLWKPPA
jgi:hypothetical protein